MKNLKVNRKALAVILSATLIVTAGEYTIVNANETESTYQVQNEVRALPEKFELEKNNEYKRIKPEKRKTLVKSRTVKPEIKRRY